MTSRSIEMSDINAGPATDQAPPPPKDTGGCQVSPVAGILFVMLAAAVAVGVGIIVHLAGGNRGVVCKCDLATDYLHQITECMKAASLGTKEICEKCPANTTTNTIIPPAPGSTATTPTTPQKSTSPTTPQTSTTPTTPQTSTTPTTPQTSTTPTTPQTSTTPTTPQTFTTPTTQTSTTPTTPQTSTTPTKPQTSTTPTTPQTSTTPTTQTSTTPTTPQTSTTPTTPQTSTTPTAPQTSTTPTTPRTTTATLITTAKPKTGLRIPTDLYPIHYNVEIQPYITGTDPDSFTFKGYVKIWLRCDVPTDNVTLHIDVLKVDPASIHFYGDFLGYTAPTYSTWTEDKERQFFILKLSGKTEVSKNYIVEMSYTSPLKDDHKGLYLSSYRSNGQQVYLATTQFQPTDARKAFPCFDEPAIKSTFNITVVRPSHLISLSNMNLIENSTSFTENGVTFVKDVYAQTVTMSTYLLAIVVCDFKFKENVTRNGLLFRTWSRPEVVNRTEHALDAGIKILPFFEEFFNVSYPLPKLDMIAFPDFHGSAMENWGLITYVEKSMLYHEGVSTEYVKKNVVRTVAHELAHQWFGNLVTPKWWDDLWLNEGFATLVQYLGMDHVHPEWKIFDRFAVDIIQTSFYMDCLHSSHPVYVPVEHPYEINKIFDDISYKKGASIIHMMRHFLGYETFRKGMMLYLSTKLYGVAFHDDLWAALTKQARRDNKDLNVKEIMDTWILQMNYPVVTVTRNLGSTNSVRVQQERYLQNPNEPEQGKYISPFNYTWNIPLTFTSSLTKNFNQTDENVYWLWRNETTKLITLAEHILPVDDNDSWIICNVQQNGYYRVQYEDSNWLALSRQLEINHEVIPVISRAQLINDAWNLEKSGMLDIKIAISFLNYFGNERDTLPLIAGLEEMYYTSAMLINSSAYESFQNFMQKKLKNMYHNFGLKNTGLAQIQDAARYLITDQACRYGIRECLLDASTQFRRWMETPNVNLIDLNLRPGVYCYAISAGGAKEWNFGLEMYSKSDEASEKMNLVYALSCSKEPWILNKYMQLILEEHSPIRKQDALMVMNSVSDNPVGRSLSWNFIRHNFDKLEKLFDSSLSEVIEAVTKSFNTALELAELEAFRAQHTAHFDSLTKAIEKVKSNLNWMSRNYEKIKSLLSVV